MIYSMDEKTLRHLLGNNEYIAFEFAATYGHLGVVELLLNEAKEAGKKEAMIASGIRG